MNKRIGIWGDFLYRGISIDETGKNVYLSKNCVMQLNEKNDIVNYSMKDLNIKKAYMYISKALEYDHNFDYLILELGYVDFVNALKNSELVQDFSKYFNLIIEEIKKYNIEILVNKLLISDFNKLLQIYGIGNKNINEAKEIYNYFNEEIERIATHENIEIVGLDCFLKKKKIYISSDGITFNEKAHNYVRDKITKIVSQ